MTDFCMSGMEAWELISPHISPMVHEKFNTPEMAQAFCVTYIALKNYKPIKERMDGDWISFMEERGLE